MGGGWEALCQFSFVKRDSPIRRMGSGEWLQSIPTPVVCPIPVLRLIIIVIVIVVVDGPRAWQHIFSSPHHGGSMGCCGCDVNHVGDLWAAVASVPTPWGSIGLLWPRCGTYGIDLMTLW